MFSTDGLLGRKFAINAAALDGIALRQQLATQNLANIDTEGYRAKTVDFERVLRSAMQGSDPGVRLHNPLGPDGAHAGAQRGASLSASFTTEEVRGKDGVDRTSQVAQMMNDNVRFRVITQQVTNSISSVRSVIAEMGRG